ncbi:efflux RND transporter periplasmic adaptor subunit [Simkania sp.]|uniref:efflux RND transporter periplasmic adaptor subunit n=1 Tax=Simkania sp. TaxID=34094 RepID=UPI003B5260DD
MKKHFISIFVLVLGISLVGCSKKHVKREPKPVPVKIARAYTKNVPYFIKTVGHMESINIVNIMAQADGRLMKTYFDDGDYIEEGELLFLIDQRPYIASLKKAEGALEESLANMMYARRTAERNSKLVQDEYISQDTFDSLVTNVQADEGIVKQNEGALDDAEINLSYTTIYSPITARAGERLLDDGNLVLQNAETPLVTLNQICPIYATFFINEKDLQKIQRCQHHSVGGLETIVSVEDPKVPSYKGPLTFIDNGVDLSTGMIKMKATLANEDKALWPNQYIQVQLNLDTIDDAVLVPYEAVQNNSKGKYVFIVKGNQTVEMRSVEVGQRQSDDTIVITKGVKDKEKVVTEGQISLYDGAKIKIVKDANEED